MASALPKELQQLRKAAGGQIVGLVSSREEDSDQLSSAKWSVLIAYMQVTLYGLGRICVCVHICVCMHICIYTPMPAITVNEK